MRHLRMCLFIGLLTTVLLWSPTRTAAGPKLPSPADWPLGGSPPVERGFDPPAERWGAGHRGVDLAAARGDPVRAAAAGTVTFAAPLAGRGVVVVDHGAVRTTYEPVAATVTPGTIVQLGTVIGRLQAGGHCPDADCLHWGLVHGEDYLDPLTLISAAAINNGGPVGNDEPIRLLPHSARDQARKQAAAREALAAAGAAGSKVAPFAGTVGDGLQRPVPGGVTSAYGMRFHPVLHVWKLHDGMDFGAPCGTPIRAPAAGVVTEAYFNGGYGNRLMVDHGRMGGHRIVTGFNHATHYVVPVGTQVRAGQVLGFVGSTGYSTGCHLHLMVWRDGAMINPAALF